MLLLAIVAAGAVSVFSLGQDVNWDLRNYHFYNAWAFVHGRLGWDLAPAQLQTFHNPLLDLPFYKMVVMDWPPRLISFVMAIPAGVGAFFLGKIVFLLFRDLPDRQRWGYSLLALAVGLTAASPVSLLGSTMNDWPGTTLIVIALWLVLRTEEGDLRWPAIAAAGALVGIASGLKLTNATYAVGLDLALLAQRPMLARGFRDALAFGVAVIAGLLLSSGAWMWTLYSHFDSPLFPYFNDIIRSPWWDAKRIFDRRFGPHTMLGWLTFPLPMFGFSADYVSEARFRDWRMPLIYLASIAGIAAFILRRVRPSAIERVPDADGREARWRMVLVFWAASLVVWANMYSVYRYAMPMELLSGAMLIRALRWSVPRRWLATAAVVAGALAILTVRYPEWGRIDYGERYIRLSLPPVAPKALVLLLADEPLAFVLPFFPSDGRFVGANNNMTDPWRTNRFADAVRRVVREHSGPLYSLTTPAGSAGLALAAYHLRRVPGGCASIESNMSFGPFELCRLERTGGAQ